MLTALHHPLRHILLTLLTLALLSVPFAHRVGAAPVTSDMTQFLSTGGETADICGETGSHLTGGCESCRIVDAIFLARPFETCIELHQPEAFEFIPMPSNLAHGHARQLSPPVRAPPPA